jgi:predicted secreted protein
MTVAVSAHGTLIKVGDAASPEAFTTILEAKDISGPGFALGTVDVTNQSSASHVREKIGSILDGGQVSFECNWKPDNATQSATAGLHYLMMQRTVRNFQIVFPFTAPVTCTFPALVTACPPSASMEGALTIAVTLEVAGAWSWS